MTSLCSSSNNKLYVVSNQHGFWIFLALGNNRFLLVKTCVFVPANWISVGEIIEAIPESENIISLDLEAQEEVKNDQDNHRQSVL